VNAQVTLFVLVDLANRTVFRGVYRPNEALIGARLTDFVWSVADEFGKNTRSVIDLRFRLYDGWFDGDGIATDVYGMLRAYVRNNYPTRRKNARIFVEVADALISAPKDRLPYTFRSELGLGRYPVRIDKTPPSGCVTPAECHLHLLRAWIDGKCPNPQCAVKTESIASYRFQKLVDTAIVADAVWFARDGEDIVIVSDDEDVIPALIAARAAGRRVIWVCSTPSPRMQYKAIIAAHAIEYMQC
jgi:uncharacterized LabA/DUF88 family protein